MREFSEVPKYHNELAVGHIKLAVQHLTLAYNAAQNSCDKGEAWGIAIALASVCSQAQGMGCLCGSSKAANTALEIQEEAAK